MRIAVTAIAALLIAACYSVIVLLLQHDKLWDWLNTLVGSGVSFVLAALAGVYLLGLQAKDLERAQRAAIKSLLEAELSDLHKLLSTGDPMNLVLQDGTRHGVLVTYVQPIAIEKACLSGLLSTNVSENLLHLARKIRLANMLCEHLLGLIRANAEPGALLHAIGNVERNRVAVMQDLTQIASQTGAEVRFSTSLPTA